MLDLLETMTEYCSTSAARQYVLRLAFFNENGVLVQYNPTSIRSASPEIELFLQSQPYRTLKETGTVANMGLYPRLNQENAWSFQYMLPVYGQTSGRIAGKSTFKAGITQEWTESFLTPRTFTRTATPKSTFALWMNCAAGF